MAPERVYVHIGPLKTGTTFLQQVLTKNKEALAADGVLFPRNRYAQQVGSALDLLDKRMHRDAPGNTGQWDRLAKEVAAWEGATAVISQEFLCTASPAQVERMVSSLAPAQVHVIYTARDYSRVVPAMWQTHLRNKASPTWDEYISSVRDPKPRGPIWGRRLWRQQDPAQVLPAFETRIPRERVHVVMVPRSTAPPDLLWQRFCQVIGIEAGRYRTDIPRTNLSLGVVEAETLRRINAGAADAMHGRNYDHLVKFFLARDILEQRRSRLTMELPSEDYGWIGKRSRQAIDYLVAGNYEILGAVDELLPGPPPDHPVARPDEVSPADVLDVMAECLTALLVRSDALIGVLKGPAMRKAEARVAQRGSDRRSRIRRQARGLGRQVLRR